MNLRCLLFGLWIVLLEIGTVTSQPLRAAAATEPQASDQTIIEEQKVDPFFGREIVFWARIRFAGTPSQVQVFFKGQNETATKAGMASIQNDEITYIHDLTTEPLTAFSIVEYWFGVTYTDDSTFVSQKYGFYYEDNRFTWQALHSAPLFVHWYDGDLAFGQSVIDVAQAGIERANELLPLTPNAEIHVYVYASVAEMQSTIQMAGMNLIAGHASPEWNVVVVSLLPGPDQMQEAQRQVPHEIMHILLYQTFGKSYDRLPTWLTEGLASNNEQYFNPDYPVILKDAQEREMLIPISSLCHGFPTEASRFYQSYAEAQSFVRFVYQQYVRSGLEKLLQNYADGLDCERGTEITFNKSLKRLDMDWQRKELKQNVLGKIVQPLLPWLAVLLIVLTVPIGLSVNSLLAGRGLEKKPPASGKNGKAAKKLRGSYDRG